MTPSQLSAIRERLDVVEQVGGIYVGTVNFLDDLRALLDEVERLTNDLAMARQVSGELCEACGWAMKFPGEPCRCEMVKWRDEWEAFKARMTEQDASSFRRGAEAMRQAVIGLAEPRATLPVKDGVDAAWCRSAQCIVDDVRAMTVPEDK
jgi:hypothetical protein